MENKAVILSLTTIAILSGCSVKDSHKGELKVIDFEKNFTTDEVDNLSSRLEIIDIFEPEFTDSTMFGSITTLLAVEGDRAYMYDGDWMATFEYPSGKVVNAFNHSGGGPGDYAPRSWYKEYDRKARQWYVLDSQLGTHGKIMSYDSSGNFVGSVRNDTINSFTSLPDGSWLAFNNSYAIDSTGFHKVRDMKVYQYTPQWELATIYNLKGRRWGALATDRMDHVMLYNNKSYVNDKDTIYRIDTDSHTLIPEISINMGKYGCDWGAFETWEELKSANEKYIEIMSPVFNSRYAFVDYILPDNPDIDGMVRVYDVYDLETNELIYRRRALLTGDYGFSQFYEGIPLDINGETAYAWPTSFVEGDMFYAMIGADEAARIKDSDLTNPILVKFRIR
ncbi:MAG: 6-bladed beta-propeller [Clostridiales bacterium]|nr:6-bladed beta-propeller [Clostridiales bacterium]